MQTSSFLGVCGCFHSDSDWCVVSQNVLVSVNLEVLLPSSAAMGHTVQTKILVGVTEGLGSLVGALEFES